MFSQVKRIFWLIVNFIVGIVPTFAFFTWVERGCALPRVGLELGWPWIYFVADTPWLAIWNLSLIFLFGAGHTFFAQARVHAALSARIKGLDETTLRSFYMSVTGLSVILVMGLWQPTGVLIWALHLPQNLTYLVSAGLFWGILGISIFLVSRLDLASFIGLRQLLASTAVGVVGMRSAGTPRLVQEGIYAHVRHPIYFFTFLAFLATPVMPLDRMLVFVGCAIYLVFALPIEERKLVALFGPDYENYRRRVPALIPFWPRRR